MIDPKGMFDIITVAFWVGVIMGVIELLRGDNK